ncbi:hypothetical protein N866_07835 [Actinotalea ferrariae CF5-4]|uniref:Uncharacterized protein n=2 Tax=Actinotalea TaxID=458839 RepID=A0A021VR62_9CELL|nr:hypothetical protein N866_07835 [Actinotalea ferrariae CF5-4]
MLRRHPWAFLSSAAVVTAAASLAGDLSDDGAGVAPGWELFWLLLTVAAGLVCAAAILLLVREDRAPHVPRRRRP